MKLYKTIKVYINEEDETSMREADDIIKQLNHQYQACLYGDVEFKEDKRFDNPKYKINIRYGYDNYYPNEEYTIEYSDFYKPQIADLYIDEGMIYPNVGEKFNFEFDKEFMVEHDTIVGLPVYITISKIN